MLSRIVIAASIIANTALGSFCMMPMAMAAEPMPHQTDATEQMMTPMAPMSHADCPDCPHHQEKQQPVSQSSCAGHCLSHANNSNPANVVIVASQLAVALPAPTRIVVSNAERNAIVPEIALSPPPIATDTVVLTL